MTHTEVYVLLGAIFFITSFGGIVIYRHCQYNWHNLNPPTRNVLRREHQDIELQDFDINSLPEYPTSQAVINEIPVRWNVNGNGLPRYSDLTFNSGNSLPGYSQISDNYINCPLEMFFPLDFLLWLKIFVSILPIVLIIIILLYNKLKIIFH